MPASERERETQKLDSISERGSLSCIACHWSRFLSAGRTGWPSSELDMAFCDRESIATDVIPGALFNTPAMTQMA